MEPLRNGKPGPNECWDELAEHSITHDDLSSPHMDVTEPAMVAAT